MEQASARLFSRSIVQRVSWLSGFREFAEREDPRWLDISITRGISIFSASVPASIFICTLGNLIRFSKCLREFQPLVNALSRVSWRFFECQERFNYPPVFYRSKASGEKSSYGNNDIFVEWYSTNYSIEPLYGRLNSEGN